MEDTRSRRIKTIIVNDLDSAALFASKRAAEFEGGAIINNYKVRKENNRIIGYKVIPSDPTDLSDVIIYKERKKEQVPFTSGLIWGDE